MLDSYRYTLIKQSVMKTWILYNFKFTVSFKSKTLQFLFNYEYIQYMLIILVSIAELEMTLNHQPFSDHFMNLPSKKASTIYYISFMYIVYLVVL